MARRNIGVAIEIPEPYRAELRDWRDRVGDPQAHQIPPHVTLLPPTSVHVDALPAIEAHLRRIAGAEREFEIVLRGSGTFRPVSPVTFVTLGAGISDCERLQAGVRSGPLARELKFPYHPHVTVAHDVDEVLLEKAFQELADYAGRFVVPGFTLFVQDDDDTWRPVRDFPFASGGA
jgi:2'-5' RNA ligase